METYAVFKDLAIILVSAKILGLLARKMKVPQVVGEIVAGLLIGPSVLGLVGQTSFLTQMAEIGVILLMFSAGLAAQRLNWLKDCKMVMAIPVSASSKNPFFDRKPKQEPKA